jgi:ABC-type glycerol-3-phosphate transport system substrate-binding protein
VVPDLMMIDMARLPALAQKGLIVPLDEMVDTDLLSDLYPFAVQAGTVDGQLVGLPFETGVEHALYNTSKIAVPPLSWTEVYSSGASYIFPTLGQAGLVNDAFLIQYLSTGGELLDSNGRPALDQQALADVLTFYRDGLENGSILADVLQYDTVRSGWRKYLQAEVVMANISSDLYLEGRGLLQVSRATWVPSQAGPPAVTLARGNAWVITAREPQRADLSGQLLAWLMNPTNMARWSTAAERLPTRRAAFEQMPRDEDEYIQFIYTQLEYAIPYPTSDTYKRIYRAMQEAVDAVLRQGEPPALAAEAVLRAVNQETGP